MNTIVTLPVKVKKLHPNAVIPKYAKPGDAGMDLVAVEAAMGEDFIQYHTGLAFEIPEGYVGLLFPRSSNSKKDLLLCNSVGVLDSGYRGEVCLRFKVATHGPAADDKQQYKFYQLGEACGQLIILPYPNITLTEVDKLSETERGAGGFGSTNK